MLLEDVTIIPERIVKDKGKKETIDTTISQSKIE